MTLLTKCNLSKEKTKENKKKTNENKKKTKQKKRKKNEKKRISLTSWNEIQTETNYHSQLFILTITSATVLNDSPNN